jgi:phosphoglycerate dehydrogenase-like enzyme
LTENIIRVACLGYVFDAVAQKIMRRMAPPEFELMFAEKPDASTPALVAECDFISCVSQVTDSMMANAPKLRLIQKWGIGVDKIDLEAAERHGIYVAITAGANADVVAEHAVMLMLAALRNLAVANRQMRSGGWNAAALRPKSRQLAGKTVGILGLGNVGRAVARRLQGFDVRILYNDIKGEFEIAGELHAEFVSFKDLLEQSDVLTVHIPANKANHHFINAEALALMKRDAVLINTARGEVIDEAALTEALRSDGLLAAGCDTFEGEPLHPDSPLRQMDNVTTTPHCAGAVLDHVAPMVEHVLRNMQLFLHNEPLADGDWIVVPANPRPGYTAVRTLPAA